MTALLRTEFIKAARRTRTLVVTVLLVGLPTLIVVVIKLRHRQGNPSNDTAEGLFRLGRQSGLLVPAPVLAVMSTFLLIVIAGVIAADSVAGDASWGNLRYLLMRPVPRGRLLVAKAIIAGLLIWAATLLVALTALIVGVIVFGAHPLQVSGFAGSAFENFHLSIGTLVARDALTAAYVAFGLTALLALGTFFSTLTDTVASAIGATIGVYIISEILDGITSLGVVRYGLPTHYLDAWQPLFTQNKIPSDMLVGVIVQLVYLAVFGSAALIWFRRKDIRS